MRILLTTEFFLSGQSTHVLDLAIQLQRLGHETEIVFTGIHTSLFRSYYGSMLTKAGVRYHHTKNSNQLTQIVQNFKPALIHSHSSTIFNLTRKLAQAAYIPYVVTCHGLGFSHPKYQLALSDAQKIIVVGPNSAAELLPKYQDKISIIPNGIDIERFKPTKKERPTTIYYIGRIDWSKLDPLKRLRDAVSNIPELQLVIVGDWKPPLENINFIPWQPDIESIMARANIVVGCGRSAREALASGCAVLLMNSKYDGLIDLKMLKKSNFNFSGNTGLSTFNQIQKDLVKLTNNRRYLRRIQRSSRDYAVTHLSSAKMAKTIISVYEEVEKKYNKQLAYLNQQAVKRGWLTAKKSRDKNPRN